MNLITNRTLEDVKRVAELSAKGYSQMTPAEQAEWLAGMKGAYNYTDLNRVERAMVELASFLGVTLYQPKTNWKITDIPTETSIAHYLENVKRLRRACNGIANTPSTPTSMVGLTYVTANNIEQILLDIESAMNGYVICGEAYCGEG